MLIKVKTDYGGINHKTEFWRNIYKRNNAVRMFGLGPILVITQKHDIGER